MKKVKQQLKRILDSEPGTIRSAVAEAAIEYDRIDCFFNDLMDHGCQSGMVSSLIYYSDTHRFYDDHYNEIESIRYELEASFGEPLRPKGDLKNWYAWMAFEETARLMADELGLQ